MKCRICRAVAVLCLMAFAAALMPGAADAQRSSRDHDRRGAHVAGRFDYYQVVLSWSPTHCEDAERGRNDTQCGRRRARPYSFVLHGLWPQYERGWPQFCRTRGRPFVPNGVINSMMDIMPSRGLIIHQYKKHGTCSGLDAPTYFKASRIAFKNVRIPKEFDAPKKALMMTPAELVTKFRGLNPTLTNDAIQVVCKRGNANQLKEVKFCITRKGAFRACMKDRGVRHKCRSGKMYIPPVRG